MTTRNTQKCKSCKQDLFTDQPSKADIITARKRGEEDMLCGSMFTFPASTDEGVCILCKQIEKRKAVTAEQTATAWRGYGYIS